MRRLLFALPFLLLAPCLAQEPAAYRSPYRLEFSFPTKELLGDLEAGDRGDPKRESSIPFEQWSSEETKRKYGVWGPPARRYPPPQGLAERSPEWKRERVLAVAARYVGYGYQHHHIPDWEPPPGWPWKEVASGKNGKGLDCSNFTSFAYNQALGVKLSSNVKEQAEATEAAVAGAKAPLKLKRLEKPESYAAFRKLLLPGDLVFIKNRKGEVGHVVLWAGALGRPEDTPLILDSHGEGVKDSQGQAIPHGIQLRPFRESSWYWTSASHGLRAIE